MRDLVATKSLIYATRRLQAGDCFTTRTHRDAQILVAIGKARKRSKVLPPPTSIKARVHPLDHDKGGVKGGAKAPAGNKEAMAKLRADYQGVVGKRPFAGWDAAELQRRIDEALAK